MKPTILKLPILIIGMALLLSSSLLAQQQEKNQNEKKSGEQIIITHKGEGNEKLTIEINGDKVTVNGKSVDEFKDPDKKINVRVHKLKDIEAMTAMPGFRSFSSGGNGFSYF
jgi:serine protease Do